MRRKKIMLWWDLQLLKEWLYLTVELFFHCTKELQELSYHHTVMRRTYTQRAAPRGRRRRVRAQERQEIFDC